MITTTLVSNLQANASDARTVNDYSAYGESAYFEDGNIVIDAREFDKAKLPKWVDVVKRDVKTQVASIVSTLDNDVHISAINEAVKKAKTVEDFNKLPYLPLYGIRFRNPTKQPNILLVFLEEKEEKPKSQTVNQPSTDAAKSESSS